ncbi:sporulation integral membrane protein YtvI [Breznakia blatticola]|uniref:Sporulation integral membrane protein YtvI n=1 Tax=Breznakia blatticola TaxID=1754012 RepID=A0A4R8A612_9FIRM|nr:sporulation integral membrane protein YtvI [Breznakia blatticola]TDW26052.1 sporulation integral membrane protein YtvI [Breznakia blatticola]
MNEEQIKTEKQRAFIIKMAYIAIIIGLIIFAFRYVLSWVLPFVLGLLVAAIMQKPVRYLAKKIKLPSKVITILCVALFYVFIGGAILLISIQLGSSLTELFRSFPDYYASTIQPAIDTLFNSIYKLVNGISPDIASNVEDLNNQVITILKDAIPTVSKQGIDIATSFVMFVPGFLIGLLMMIISSFFIAIDFDRMAEFFMLQFNDNQKVVVRKVKSFAVGTLAKIIKSYAMIMSITFVEVAIGLSILGVDNAIGLAFFIAIFDILPVLGTGGIMIPWTLITLINGNVELAIGLFIVYVIVTIIRNIIEPKIVGVQVNANPVLMLLAIFLGARILGFTGIISLPILVIVIKNLNEEGVIHLYKNLPAKE